MATFDGTVHRRFWAQSDIDEETWLLLKGVPIRIFHSYRGLETLVQKELIHSFFSQKHDLAIVRTFLVGFSNFKFVA